MLRHDTRPLYLQPTEVESAHWVPMRYLQTSELRTFQRCDISERFDRVQDGFIRHLLGLIVGQMLFTAIVLPPAESVYSVQVDVPADLGLDSNSPDVALLIKSLFQPRKPPLIREKPIILWGLTLGITADFLELIAPLGLSKLWDMPTLSSWDVRFCTWIFDQWQNPVPTAKDTPVKPLNEAYQVNGTDNKTFATSFPGSGEGSSQHNRGATPRSHYQTLRRGAITALVFRSGMGILLLSLFIQNSRRRHWSLYEGN